MKISVFDDMELCSEAEVKRLKNLVPASRVEQAMAFKHVFGQFACLKAFDMLSGLVGSQYGIFDKEKLSTFIYNEHEKPSFKYFPEIHFNISHCKQGIAVAVDDEPIGIDIECTRHYDEILLDKTMSSVEINEIKCSADPAVTFIKLWTKKEAVLKLRGTGIVDDLQSVLLGKEYVASIINVEKQYALSVASNTKMLDFDNKNATFL